MMPRQRTMTQQSTPTQQGVALDLHELASKKPANASTHRAGNSRIITADAHRGGLLQRSAAAASAAAELLLVVSVALAIGALAGDTGRRARSTRHVARAGPARRSERRDARSARTAAVCHARTTAILAVLLAMVARGMAAHAPVNAVIATRGAAARALTTRHRRHVAAHRLRHRLDMELNRRDAERRRQQSAVLREQRRVVGAVVADAERWLCEWS